jgi:hypothetical protein
MIVDPQVITVATIAKSMPRISDGIYQLADLTFGLDITHRSVTRDKKKRVVHTVKFSQRKIVADPLTAANDYETLTESVQIDRPEVGFSSTEVSDMWTGFKTWFDTTMMGKIYGRER